MIDEGEALGLLRGQHLARHEQLLGLGEADELRPDDRSAVPRDEPHPNVRVADPRGVRGDDDVAEEGERGAQAGGGAVQPADNRLLEVEEVEHDLLGLGDQAPERRRVVDHRLEPGHVAAGAEGPPGARQDDDVAPGIVLHVAEDAGEVLVHRRVHGVQRLRPVDRHGEDASPAVEAERLVAGVFHGRPPGRMRGQASGLVPSRSGRAQARRRNRGNLIHEKTRSPLA